MKKELKKRVGCITVIALIFTLFLIGYSIFKNPVWLFDLSLTFAGLIIVYYYFERLNLNLSVYLVMLVAIMLNNLGVFWM
jgi:hypothetical protein